MENEILSMIYKTESENDESILAQDVQGEAMDNYVALIAALKEKLNDWKQVSDIESVIYDLMMAYEKKAYIEGFKKGFKFAQEL